MTDDTETTRLDDLLQPPAAVPTDATDATGAEPSTAPADSGAASFSPRDATASPRTRWAGIVWGLVLAAIAGAGIWLASGDGRLDDLAAWVRDLSAAAAVGYGVLAVGLLLLVAGVVGLLRRAQRAVSARRMP